MTSGTKQWYELADRYALSVGGASLLLCILAGVWPPMRASFFNAWLFAWLFWLAVSLGSMALSMMHHLTGGDWGTLIRPITNSAAQVLPVLFLLFLPIFLGMSILFPWARPLQLVSDPILMHAHAYLNTPFFFLRFLLYFIVWTGLTWGLTHITDAGLLRRISAGGLVIYVLLMTLGGVDWIMSRQAHWVSSIFGFIMVISQTLTALCFVVVILRDRIDQPPIARFAKPQDFVDLGNLLLMFVILWAYMNFAQYLITWTGNEQPDVGWYVQRSYGGWRVVAGIIIFIHFLLPFFLLLMRPLKADIHRLGAICAGLLLLRILDLYWNVGPQKQADPHGGFVLSPLDILAWIGMGGVWYAAFSHYLKRAPLLAISSENPGPIYGTSEA
jgi:hypothetical protein